MEVTKPKLKKDNGDFRIYEPEQVTDRDGKTNTIQLCEELVDGRWEGFYSILSYPTDQTAAPETGQHFCFIVFLRGSCLKIKYLS